MNIIISLLVPGRVVTTRPVPHVKCTPQVSVVSSHLSLVTSHNLLVAMFGSLILRSLSTGPALAEVVVMGGGLMGTGIAQVCIPQYWAVWSAKILKVTHLVCLDRCPDPAQGDPG